MEIWKEININTRYMVSNKARVKNIKTGRVLKNCLMLTGYCCVNINNSPVLLHRLVAIAFIPNPLNKKCINHKNGIRSDNRIKNLEWATHSENCLHAFRELGRIPSALGVLGYDNPSSKAILQIDKAGNKIKEFGSMLEAMRETGIHNKNISSVCRGKRKHAGGFKWKYIN